MSDHIEHSCFHCGSLLHGRDKCPARDKEQRNRLPSETERTAFISRHADATPLAPAATEETEECRRCSGTGSMTSEVSPTGEASCGACRGTSRVPATPKAATRTAPPCCDGKTLVFGCRFECRTCGYVFDGQSWPPPKHTTSEPAGTIREPCETCGWPRARSCPDCNGVVVAQSARGEPFAGVNRPGSTTLAEALANWKPPTEAEVRESNGLPSRQESDRAGPSDEALQEIWNNYEEGRAAYSSGHSLAHVANLKNRALYNAGRASRDTELSEKDARIASLEADNLTLRQRLDIVHEVTPCDCDCCRRYFITFCDQRSSTASLTAANGEHQGRIFELNAKVASLTADLSESKQARDSAIERAGAMDVLVSERAANFQEEEAMWRSRLGELEAALRICLAEIVAWSDGCSPSFNQHDGSTAGTRAARKALKTID